MLKAKLLVPLGLAAAAGYIVYSSMKLQQVECEACMEFRAQKACRKASGATREEAMRTAVNNACALIAFGREDGMACTQMTPPKSVSCK